MKVLALLVIEWKWYACLPTGSASDYIEIDRVVTFNFDQDSASNPWLDDAIGSGMQTVSTSILVTIIDDDVLEGNEQFYISLETRDTSVDLSLMNTTEVTIIDNDGMHKLYRCILLYEEPCDLCKRAYIPLP